MSAPKNMTTVDSGTENGIDWATCQAPLYGAINGYVRVPDDHPWANRDYDDPELSVEVNGGLTYAREGWIGFDTLHMGDLWPNGGQPHFCVPSRCHCVRWTPELVAEETRELARQVAEASHV